MSENTSGPAEPVESGAQPNVESHDPPVPDAYAAFMRTGWADREQVLPPHPVVPWAAARRERLGEQFPGERLVVCRNPDLARERARKREELLAATERDLARVARATRRRVRPLRGRAEIGLAVGAVPDDGGG